jgi:hypothetical protein
LYFLIIPRSPKGEGGILFYLCPSFRPSFRPSKIFFVAFFSVTVDGNEKLKAIKEIEGTNKTEEDKKEMAHINGLFCVLHILQNMATVALNGMKTFEKANNVSNPNSIYEGNSVCNEFIYEVAKSFIEMSGKHTK